ncbi:MAG: TIR domain-containing protein [Candidatus Thiodiazotropha sp.]
MATLKLFISHSSRLDDVDGAQDTDENWELLKELCETIKAKDFDLEVEVLVDQFIGTGTDWEKHLNLWLAECHAAIILYSKRALQQSDWVKKEATILHWRWQVEKDFPLLPVFFEDETNIEDAKASFWQAIGLQQVNSATCPRDAAAIVNEIEKQPRFQQLLDRLKSQAPLATPFTDIASELKIHLDDERIFSDLQAAWNSLNHADKPDAPADTIEALVNNLIRFLLVSPTDCMRKLYDFSALIKRRETRERMQEVHGALRAIWVNAGAATWLPAINRGDAILALNGIHLNDRGSIGMAYTDNFTVDRYIKRMWHNDVQGVLVSLTDQTTIESIEEEIWKKCRIYNPHSDPKRLRKQVNRKEFVVVYLPVKDVTTGLPDAERAMEIIGLRQHYPNLRVVIASGEQPLDGELPGIQPIEPALDIEIEDDQYLNDCDLQGILGPLSR